MQTVSRDFYIYIYFRPNGEPCYVGKGRGARWREHIKRSCNRHLRRIMALTDCELPCVKVRVGLSEAEAFEAEKAFIKAIGREPNGPLVNATDGGEGQCGAKFLPSRRAAMSASRRGYRHSEETKAKISKSHRGLTLSDATKHLIASKRRGRPAHNKGKPSPLKGLELSAEIAAKISKGLTGRTLSEETKRKISAARMGKVSPRKGAVLSEETKRKITVSLENYNRNRKAGDAVRHTDA